MMTSKEERARLAELCALMTRWAWTHDTTDSFAKEAHAALPRLLADHDELERKVREFVKACPTCSGRGAVNPRKPNPIAAFLEWDRCPTCAALRAAVEGEK